MPIAVNITDCVAQYWEEGEKQNIHDITHEAFDVNSYASIQRIWATSLTAAEILVDRQTDV